MIFDKLFRKKSKEKMLGRIELFKQNHQEDYRFEEFMIDKNGEEVCLIVTYYEDSNAGIIHIFDYDINNDKVLFYIEGDALMIGDLRILRGIKRGIGSKSIEILEKIAIQHNVFKIRGKLYSSDEENRERQIHFYTKNGFKIMGTSLEKEIKS